MSSSGRYDELAAQLRRPGRRERDDRQLVRLATLAASSHNTQPWLFRLCGDTITILPDRTRRCPVVDPDDAHLFRSLGCAAENLVHAAAGQGLESDVRFDPARDAVVVRLHDSPGRGPSDLGEALLTRQCSRTTYDGTRLSRDELETLRLAAKGPGTRCTFLLGAEAMSKVAAAVTRGNLDQLTDPDFRSELLDWIRFNPRAAMRTGDGLAGRCTARPPVPTRVGRRLSPVLLRARAQADRDARALHSSAGVAVFVSAGDDPAAWFEVGRAYERFALRAETIDVRTAFVNQPVEVPLVRGPFEGWLGLQGENAQLVVRFGRGPRMPWSLRRPVDEVIVS